MTTVFTNPINNASTTLAIPYTPSSGSMTVTDASSFGSPSVLAPLRITVQSVQTGLYSIFKVTNISGRVLTIAGTLEGTSDLSFVAGDLVQSTVTAGHITDIYNAFNGLGTASTQPISAFAQTQNNLSDLNSVSAARTNLQLGTIATQAASSVAITGGTITGVPIQDHGGQVYNVKAYGAKGDGTTDDYAAISNLISSVGTSGGGTIFLPKGTYLISKYLNLCSNLTWIMDQDTTLLMAPTITQSRAMYLNTVTDVLITGGTIDGNKANNPNGTNLGIEVFGASQRITIRNVHVKNMPADSSGGNSGDGIYIGCNAGSGIVASDVLVEGCNVHDCVRMGVSVIGGQRVRIIGNSIANCNLGGCDCEPNSNSDPMTDIVFANNNVYNCASGFSCAAWAGETRVAVVGNVFYGQGDNATTAFGDTAGIGNSNINLPNLNYMIVGNVIENFKYGAILPSPNIIFSDNQVNGCRYGVQASGYNLHINNVQFNQIWGEWTIRVQANNVLISGCHFYNCTDTARLTGLSVTPIGVIYLIDSWWYPIISNNFLLDDRTSNSAATGVRLTATAIDLSTYQIIGNHIKGFTSQFVNGASSGASAFANKGVGPVNSASQLNPTLDSQSTLLGTSVGNLFSANGASFETGVQSLSVSNCTATQSTDFALEGTHSAKIVSTVAGPSVVTISMKSTLGNDSGLPTLIPGQTYTGVVHMRAGSAGSVGTALGIRLQAEDSTGTFQSLGSLNTTVTGNATGGWQKYTFTATVPNNYGQSSLSGYTLGNIVISWTPSAIGDYIYLDCAGIFPGYNKSWCNGGQTLAEISPTQWTITGSSTANQPFWLNAGAAGPINLNVLGSTGGTQFGDGKGNVVASMSNAGVLTGNKVPLSTKTTTYAIVNTDNTIIADATSAGFTVTLPSPTGITGQKFTVFQKASSGHTVSVAPHSTETINGSNTAVSLSDNTAKTFVSDGTNWWTV